MKTEYDIFQHAKPMKYGDTSCGGKCQLDITIPISR